MTMMIMPGRNPSPSPSRTVGWRAVGTSSPAAARARLSDRDTDSHTDGDWRPRPMMTAARPPVGPGGVTGRLAPASPAPMMTAESGPHLRQTGSTAGPEPVTTWKSYQFLFLGRLSCQIGTIRRFTLKEIAMGPHQQTGHYLGWNS
jgi:hypothetical protein